MASQPNPQPQGGGFNPLELIPFLFNIFSGQDGSGPFDDPITERDSGPAFELLQSYHGNGLSNEEVEVFRSAIFGAKNRPELEAIIDRMTLQATVGQLQSDNDSLNNRIEQTRLNTLGNIDSFESSARPQLQAFVDRFEGIRDGGVRSDAGFAKILGDAEKQLAAQVNTVQLGAAKGLADAGARGAGKAVDRTRAAESRAFGELSNVSSTLASQAETALMNARKNLVGFDEQVLNARNAAEAGAVPSLLGAQQLSQATPIPGGGFGGPTAFDITSANLGAGFTQQGIGLQGILGFLGAGQNSIDGFFQGLSGLKGG